MRLKIIRIIVSSALLMIAFQLFYSQIIKGRYYYDLSRNNRIRVVPTNAGRGQILDRNGVKLADNRLAFNVMVIPQDVENREALFRFLGQVLDKYPEELLREFRRDTFAPFAPVTVAEDISRDQMMILEENKFRFPGLLIQVDSRRFYPFDQVGAHVLGYVGKINRAQMERMREYGYSAQSMIGYSGVEEFYDRFLRGEDGGLQIEVNSRGAQERLLSIKEPTRGKDIVLTIDQRLQSVAYDVMQDRSGAVLVMDMDNGELLSLISAPAFDPNIFVDEKKRYQSSALFSDVRSPLLNRASRGQYPPGSVFKIPVALAALESGKTTPYTSFICHGYFELGNRRFRCAHVHGSQDLIAAIAHSCNVYFNHLGTILGPDPIGRFAKLLGLGTPTGIDLPYEGKGLIPGPAQRRMQRNQGWYKGDTVNLSIGQGDVLTTPLQLVHMMAAVGSNGKILIPHLIKSVGSQDYSGKFSSAKRLTGYNPKNLETILIGMRNVVRDFSGTAHILDLPGIVVSGKTGTAQAPGNRDHHAWFVGFIEAGEKRWAFCVFLENGGSSYNACVVARDLLLRIQAEKILPL